MTATKGVGNDLEWRELNIQIYSYLLYYYMINSSIQRVCKILKKILVSFSKHPVPYILIQMCQ